METTELFHTRRDVSTITAILPQQLTNACIQSVFDQGDQNALVIHARGTLVKERWYQAFVPFISPEKDYLQFIVPSDQVNSVIERITTAGKLHLPGSGAVFEVPCERVEHTEDFMVWSWSNVDQCAINLSRRTRQNLAAIFCTVQPDRTEAITRAAMQAGAHGPVVFYTEGSGLRDRLGWLKITKRFNKEVLIFIVDSMEADAITDAIVDAGDIHEPGRGFVYQMPVNKGMINIASTYGAHRYAASTQQMIAAIDNLMGHTLWRNQRLVDTGYAGRGGASPRMLRRIKRRRFLSDQAILCGIVPRAHSKRMMEAALNAGAPGASISYAKFIEANAEEVKGNIRLNREHGVIRIIMPRKELDAVLASMKALTQELELSQVCFFIQPVSKVLTYFHRHPASAASTARSTIKTQELSATKDSLVASTSTTSSHSENTTASTTTAASHTAAKPTEPSSKV